MQELVQPVVSVPFKLSNGVSLKATAHARMIKSSHRVDAKSIGIDWNAIYVGISLDSGEYGPRIVDYMDICAEDAEYYLNEKLVRISSALGSADHFQAMQNAVFLALHNVKQLKKD